MDKKILIIDDDEGIRESLEICLEDSGFKVITASNGAEGINHFLAHRPDITILDLYLPDMSGFSILKRLKDQYPDYPVIVISGEADKDEILKVLKGGAWEFIAKPIIDLGILDVSVQKCLDRKNMLMERKIMMDKLIESEQKYRSFFEGAADVIMIIDPVTLRITDYNSKLYQVLGYDGHMLDYMTVDHIDLNIKNKAPQEIINAKGNRKNFYEFETQYVTKWDEIKDFSIRSTFIDHGEKTYINRMCRDITEEKKVGRTINKFHKRLYKLEQIIDNSPAVVFSWSTEKNWPINFVSKNIERFGYSYEDIVNKKITFLDIVCQDDLETIINNINYFYSLSDKNTFHQEYRIMTATGEERWVDERIWKEKNEKGKIENYQGIVWDITERKQTERELQAAIKKAKKANQAQSQFVANVSHEIRTPMNAIIGFSEMLLERLKDENEIKYAKRIMAESDLLLKLINDILDASKINSGQFSLSEDVISIKKIIDHNYSIHSFQANKKNLEFNVHMGEGIPSSLVGDEMRINQILYNLINNAIKFTEKGKVELFVELLEEKDVDCVLLFKIKDTGIGMTEETRKKIFKSFVQADGSMSRKYGGTGLGTFISKQLVNMMKGKIKVASKENEGSTFEFTLVLKKAKTDSVQVEDADYDDKEDGGELKGLKVLVVEDYPTNQEIVCIYLDSLKIKWDLAINGLDAVKKAERKKYDFILMDIQMPVMNGYDASLKIRRESGINRDTPIIALTANAHETDKIKASEAGMVDFISKPFRKNELLMTLGRWTKHELINQDAISNLREEEPSHGKAKGPSELPLFEYERALEEFGDDEEILNHVIERFLKNVDEQFPKIEQALQNEDLVKVANEAHSIKGGSGNLRGMRFSRAAADLEKSAKDKNTNLSKDNFIVLKREKEEFQKCFNQYHS